MFYMALRVISVLIHGAAFSVFHRLNFGEVSCHLSRANSAFPWLLAEICKGNVLL